MKVGVILHVEDDDNWIKIIKEVLQDQGNYLLSFAKTVEQAKKNYGDFLMVGHVPELVILDISLSSDNSKDRGGLEFAETLISLGLTDKTSIIILSDNIDLENMLHLFREYKYAIVDVFRKSEFKHDVGIFVQTVKNCLARPTAMS